MPRLNGGHSAIVNRGFFLLFAAAVVFLFWKIIAPYAVVLATAGVAAILLAPLDTRLRKAIRHPRLSALLLIALLFCVVVGPLIILLFFMIGQGIDLAKMTIADPRWIDGFKLEDQQWFVTLPQALKGEVAAVDIGNAVRNMSNWVSSNLTAIFSGGLAFLFETFIFFICVYYFLVDRERIVKALVSLSPLEDRMDRKILGKIVETVRGVIFGTLIVAVIQAILAGIGMVVFGVPGASIWAALTIIASQIPLFGTALILIPVILYLFFAGHLAASIGLAVWSALVVGLADNILQPYFVSGKTHMHALLILISMLGGLQFFGPIGFILGPAVLAAFLVVVELYKAGMFEKKHCE